ncbi:MAG TPA: glycosyltransferase family 39 protein [Kofleriaceae bacterium]|nr:glycosyltransferase family 39 protein [Kofleriaceae bacterium]
MAGRLLDRLLARPWIALAVALVGHAALWLAVQRDIHTADPLYYASNAHDLAFHPAELLATRDHLVFVMRLGLTAPIALAYRLCGVSTLATNLPCLVAGLAILAIAYAAATTARAKLLAVAFAAVCTPLLLDGRELTPDLPCAAAMAGSILCLARRDRPRGAWWVAGAAVLWFAAFQIKEVAVWCAPAWLYAVIRDLRDRGGRWVVHRFAPAAAIGAALAAGYLALCAALWGDPLVRFQGVEDAAAEHSWSLVGHPAREWIARLTWQPAVLLFELFRAALVPAALSVWLVRGRDRIWVVATAGILALYWFGSTSASVYLPLPPHRRMLLPALPGLIILAALASDAALDRIRGRWPRLGLALAFVVLLGYPHVVSLRKIAFDDRPESAAYARLRAELAATGDPVVLVCGDIRCPLYARFYVGFEPPANLTIVMASQLAATPLPGRARVRLLAHLERSGGTGKELARRAEALGLPAILSHPELRLYDAGDGARLRDALTGLP